MSLMQSPEATILLHRVMVREEREQTRHPRVTDLSPQRRQSTIRTVIGHLLIAAGARLSAQHEPADRAIGHLSIAR